MISWLWRTSVCLAKSAKFHLKLHTHHFLCDSEQPSPLGKRAHKGQGQMDASATLQAAAEAAGEAAGGSHPQRHAHKTEQAIGYAGILLSDLD